MTDLKQFRLPDVGEGLTEADILSWAVQPGDTVVVNQTLVEVETAKAAVELPSPFAGVVHALHAEAGETVAVGNPIITIDVAPGGSGGADASGGGAPVVSDAAGAAGPGVETAGTPPAPAAASPDRGERQAVLVGYGPRSGPVARRARRTPAQDVPVPTAQAAFAAVPVRDWPEFVPEAPAPAPAPAVTAPLEIRDAPTLAKPPVRKLAKDLGVDLATLTPTGPHGTVSREDVRRAVDDAAEAVPAGAVPPRRAAPGSAVREERIPIKGVRKHTAAAMVASAFTAPHVTEFITADVTAMMDLRKRIAARPDFAGVKVSPLLLVARAVLWAARRTPIINSTWDDAAGEIVVKHYVNLGIAAATDRGLIVPNIKDADALSLRDLADAMSALTDTARSGRTGPADMSGGTFTITNVGVFGVDTGTPIINPGESAILAFGAVRRAPWVIERDGVESIEPRWVTQLAVSFDHRLVDGQQGSQFLADVAAVLSDPGLALL